MRLPVLTMLALTLATPGHAAEGTWSLIAESGGCEVSFLPEAVDDGIFFVDRGTADCGPDLSRVTGYALNEDGAVVVLYSTLSGVELIGNLTRREDGVFAGTLRSGSALRLEHRSGPRGITDPASGLRTGEDAVIVIDDDEEAADESLSAAPQSGPCLSYAGGTTCADQADIGPPEGSELQVLTRMNMRDQGTTRGTTVIGRIDAGSCVPVSFCSEDEQGRLWCGVTAASGPGYILKQDDQTVYARNSCR